MTDKKLTLLECISNVSPFKEQEAEALWLELLENVNIKDLPSLDQKKLRQLFAGIEQFADCTAITR